MGYPPPPCMQHGGTAWLCCRPRPSLPESPRNTEVLPSPQCSLETTFPLDLYDTCGGVIGLDTEPGLASSVWPGSACLSGSRAPSSTLQLSRKEHLDQLGSTPLSPMMPSNHKRFSITAYWPERLQEHLRSRPQKPGARSLPSHWIHFRSRVKSLQISLCRTDGVEEACAGFR